MTKRVVFKRGSKHGERGSVTNEATQSIFFFFLLLQFYWKVTDHDGEDLEQFLVFLPAHFRFNKSISSYVTYPFLNTPGTFMS